MHLELHVAAIDRQVLQAPNNSTVESAFLRVQVNIIVEFLFHRSSYTRCWCRPAINSPIPCCATLSFKYFGLGAISVLSLVQHSLTFAGFVPHAHLVHRPHYEKDFLGPDPTPVWVRCHADRPCALLNEHIQLKVSKELWCCITSVETLLFKAFCHEVFPACSSASSAIQLFSQSPQHRGRVPNAACCSNQTAAGSTWHCSSSSTWKYALVTSAVNV